MMSKYIERQSMIQHPVKTEAFFPLTIHSENQSVMNTRESKEIKYNVDSLKDES